jgi:hypothetical protein
MPEIEWLYQDDDSFAHVSKLRVGGKSTLTPLKAEVISPHHATTRGEDELLAKTLSGSESKPTLVIAGESLLRPTLQEVGYSKEATDMLIARLKSKTLPNHINLVYTRIPSGYSTKAGARVPAPPLDQLRASALVDAQLEAGASLVIPPLPSGLASRELYRLSLERTQVAIQTASEHREMVGYIPTTDHLEVARDLVGEYVKQGVRFFAVDFSGAPNQPSLMRTVVRTIRERLGLRRRAREAGDRYYLHVFNVATSRKSSNAVTPVADIITHPYGVDSTSGQMWGGGAMLNPDLFRYYNVDDYGAYQRRALTKSKMRCGCPTCSGHTVSEVYSGPGPRVYQRLKIHRISAYREECGRITERLAAGQGSPNYVPYLGEKAAATSDISRILADVREIRAAL